MTRRDGAGEIEARSRDSPASSVRAPRSRDSKSASQRSWRSNPLRSTMRGATDIDATDIKERTALHHAAMMDRLDVVELLLEWDADLYAKDQKYSSPQDAAADLVAQDEGDVGVAASLRSGTYPDRARAAGARRGARGQEGRRGRWVATRARTHRVGRPQRRRGREDDRQHRLVLLSKVLVKIKRD